MAKETSIWKKASSLFSSKKSIANSFAINEYGNYRTYMQQPGKPVWTPRAYDRFADEAYSKNVIAHRCIAMIAKSVSSVPWKLFDNSTDIAKELPSHPLLNILSKPNTSYCGNAFFEAVSAFELIAGNSYILAIGPNDGSPTELHILRPDRVNVIAGQNITPSGYIHRVGNNEKKYLVNPVSGQSQILHLKSFHPLDDYYGLSPIEAAAYSIDQHNQAAMWNQSLLQNGAKPSGALIVKSDASNGGNLTDTQFAHLKNQIDEQYSGAANAGRPLLLEGGLEWKEMSLSPKDMDFIESKNSSARDIALAFGVPPQLLGIPGDNSYNNMAEARLALWEQTIIPQLNKLTTSLNNWLVPQFSNTLTLRSDLDSISALSPRREALWNRVNNANFLSTDEKRKILGL